MFTLKQEEEVNTYDWQLIRCKISMSQAVEADCLLFILTLQAAS